MPDLGSFLPFSRKKKMLTYKITDCKWHFICVTRLLPEYLKLENLMRRQHHNIRFNLGLDYEGK